MNHFLNPLKPINNDRQHCRMSFRSPAIAGVRISTVTVLSITSLSVTLNPLRSWSSDRPKQIAVDNQSNLWILQGKDASKPPKILPYSKTGTLLSKQITEVVDPTALAIDNQDRLLVADNSPRQQVLIYDISGTPKLQHFRVL